MLIRKGVRLLEEEIGDGSPAERQHNYLLAMRITLNHGDVVRCSETCPDYRLDKDNKTQDDGYFLHLVRIDRENLIGGICYAVQEMCVGGYRKVAISPHLVYGEKGIPDLIPPNAKLIVEIRVLEER